MPQRSGRHNNNEMASDPSNDRAFDAERAVTMELPDLDGKVLGVVPAQMPSGQGAPMILLERVKLETVAGRLFVTGYVPADDPGNWTRGLPTGVAWDLVGYYVVFGSLEEYRKRYKEGGSWWRRFFAWIHGAS
jgi:hypothetical protein